jgi:SAM-dependent methyltransferase
MNLTFRVPIEGDISEKVSVVHEPGVDANVMSRVNFKKGDACALSDYAEDRVGFGTFDGVVLSNLLCRLPDPRACLNALPKIVNRGGVVVIVTPFSWSEGGQTGIFSIDDFKPNSPNDISTRFLFLQTTLRRVSGLGVILIQCLVGQFIRKKH